jgi:Fe-S cluster biogenesis protein NfuA
MIEEKIKAVLDEIRPHLQMDGGDVEFVSFDEKSGVLSLKLKGACHGCPMAVVTLQDGIGRTMKAKVPEVKEIKSV